MKTEFSLQARIASALGGIALLVSIAYLVSVNQFIETLENELMDRTVRRELAEAVRELRESRRLQSSFGKGLTITGVAPGDAWPKSLPAALRDWPAGTYDEYEGAHTELYVGREDVGATRVYLVYDIAHVETLERSVVVNAVAAIGVAALASILLGWLLARRIVRPVSDLANQVRAWQPGDSDFTPAADIADSDVGAIASALTRFSDRLGEFISREREFTDDASHELRTPITIIRGAIVLMQEDASLGPHARDRLGRIDRAAEQMQDIVESLLFLARERDGPRPKACDLESTISDLANTLLPVAQRKGLTLTLKLNEPAQVMAPPGMVACVSGNVIRNAIDHTAAGSITIDLQGGRLTVTNTSAVSGIPDARGPFERGVRGESSEGMGIGLHLVRRICERMNWRVALSSNEATGTTISVQFV